MKHIFIVNPIAGKGKGPEIVVPQLKKVFNNEQDYKVFITRYKGHTAEICEKLAQSSEPMRIYACGGEGTCFDVLNAVVNHPNISIGVIPCGSANDFLKFFGEKDLFFDIKEQINAIDVPVDLIKANEFYCLNGCSVGMDAVVAHDMSIFKSWPGVSGSAAYKLAVVKTFLRKVGDNFKITVDGKLLGIKNCLFAVCANGPVYGGGYKSAPYANPFDGKLDFTIVETISKLKVPAFLKRYEQGKHECFDYCSLGTCNSFEIEAERPVPVNLDGEIIERQKLKFEIVKNGIKFALPKRIAEKYTVDK